MKVYLAAPFSWKEEIKQKALELKALGITVTSRWLNEVSAPTTKLHEVSHTYKQETALTDLEDIGGSDFTVLFTIDPEGPCKPRGGRHFESGYALGLGRQLVVVGPLENIFHYLPNVVHFEEWETAKGYLLQELEHEKAIYAKVGESVSATDEERPDAA